MRKRKPINLWYLFASIAMGIVTTLLPRTPKTITCCLIIIFLLLIHPVWYFWWIEETKTRRVVALACLVSLLTAFGYFVWPLSTPQTSPTTPTFTQQKQPTAEEIVSEVIKKLPVKQPTPPALKKLSPFPKPPVAKSQDVPEVEKIPPPNNYLPPITVTASSSPVRVCKDHPSEDFPRQGPPLKISVIEVKKELGKHVVNGTFSRDNGGKEYNTNTFTSVPVGYCMPYDIYSITVKTIANNADCAEFVVSFDENPCKQK